MHTSINRRGGHPLYISSYNSIPISTSHNSSRKSCYNSEDISSLALRLANESISSKNFYTQQRTLEQLNRLPYKNKDELIYTTLISILHDESTSITERYKLINSEFLSNVVAQKIHQYYFLSFNPPLYPLINKIMSSQYLLLNCRLGEIDKRGVLAFLSSIALNNQDYSIRAECIDILRRAGVMSEEEFQRLMGYHQSSTPTSSSSLSRLDQTLSSLSEDKQRVVIARKKTTYEDKQNVHTTSINESVKTALKKLQQEFPRVLDPTTRSTLINELSQELKHSEGGESLDRIMIDTSQFVDDLKLSDVLILVWCKIKNSPHRLELKKRLLEELSEMKGMCSTGHLTRLVNVLSGFFEGVITLSMEEQLKNYITKSMTDILNSHDKLDELLEEMVKDDGDKPLLLELINSETVKENKKKLKEEFLAENLENLENLENFEDIYNNTINFFCGIKK